MDEDKQARLEAFNQAFRKIGYPDWTIEDLEDWYRQEKEMREHSYRKIAIGLEFSNGEFLPDGAGGVVPNNGRWVRDANGNWVTASSLENNES